MRTLAIVFSLACLVSVSSVAQQPVSLSGNWVAKFDTPKGEAREVTIVIRDNSGTWFQQAVRNNPCTGREMPITVDKVAPDGFELTRSSSKVLAGCPDISYQLKRVDDKVFEGVTPDGRKIQFIRQ